MAPDGIQSTLAILVAQGEAQAAAIRNLTALCRMNGVPGFRIAQALRPLVMDLGAQPGQEQGPEDTQPVSEVERQEEESIRRADEGTPGGRPTLKLATVQP